jgi:hypothetical protein
LETKWSITAAWEEWLLINDLSYAEVARRFSEIEGKKISSATVRNMTLSDGFGAKLMQLAKYIFPDLNLEWFLTGEGEPRLAGDPDQIKDILNELRESKQMLKVKESELNKLKGLLLESAVEMNRVQKQLIEKQEILLNLSKEV